MKKSDSNKQIIMEDMHQSNDSLQDTNHSHKHNEKKSDSNKQMIMQHINKSNDSLKVSSSIDIDHIVSEIKNREQTYCIKFICDQSICRLVANKSRVLKRMKQFNDINAKIFRKWYSEKTNNTNNIIVHTNVGIINIPQIQDKVRIIQHLLTGNIHKNNTNNINVPQQDIHKNNTININAQKDIHKNGNKDTLEPYKETYLWRERCYHIFTKLPRDLTNIIADFANDYSCQAFTYSQLPEYKKNIVRSHGQNKGHHSDIDIQSNLLIVSHVTFFEWKKILKQSTNLKVKYLCKKSDFNFRKDDIRNGVLNNYDLVLINVNRLRLLYDSNYVKFCGLWTDDNCEYIWRRVFVEDSISINIKNKYIPYIKSHFLWILTVTLAQLFLAHKKTPGFAILRSVAVEFELKKSDVLRSFVINNTPKINTDHNLTKYSSCEKKKKLSPLMKYTQQQLKTNDLIPQNENDSNKRSDSANCPYNQKISKDRIIRSNQQISNQQISKDRILRSNQQISNQQISNQQISNQQISNQQISNQQISKDRMLRSKKNVIILNKKIPQNIYHQFFTLLDMTFLKQYIDSDNHEQAYDVICSKTTPTRSFSIIKYLIIPNETNFLYFRHTSKHNSNNFKKKNFKYNLILASIFTITNTFLRLCKSIFELKNITILQVPLLLCKESRYLESLKYHISQILLMENIFVVNHMCCSCFQKNQQQIRQIQLMCDNCLDEYNFTQFNFQNLYQIYHDLLHTIIFLYPTERKRLLLNKLWYVITDIDQLKLFNTLSIDPELKIKTMINQIKGNLHKQHIIFAKSNVHNKIIKLLTQAKIKSSLLVGNSDCIAKAINTYRNHQTNVLLLDINKYRYYMALNLSNTDEIYVYNHNTIPSYVDILNSFTKQFRHKNIVINQIVYNTETILCDHNA
jgi:hypothetical protein